MIDALFGSKTRVKLLYLFLNNPGQSFYVREITRKIGEQINSVRRELANMISVGIIVSDSSDNKLYYQVNQQYEHYLALSSIFGDASIKIADQVIEKSKEPIGVETNYISLLKQVPNIRLAVLSGSLVRGSVAPIDLLIVGGVTAPKLKTLIDGIESSEGREINYSVLPYDEFYYRLSVKDKFLTEVLKSKHVVAVDEDNILEKQ
ncbi:transcriptional regulator [Candidatus Saccharibacteria bacterium]|nr:transcriptional regulator [Candidatus Saccharibacteria bacterium]